MLNLILAILSSALVSIVMRLGSSGEEPRKPMLAVNYAVCAAVSLCFLNRGAEGGGMGLAAGMGLIGGALYLGAFLLLQYNVRANGVTLSAAFMKLGVVVPTVLGFTLFHEPASAAHVAGLMLTAAAIMALAGQSAFSAKASGSVWTLILLLLCGGMADGLSKFFAAYGDPALEGHFLCFIFVFALLMCAALCAALRQRPNRRDFVFGALLGVPNYFSSRFLLLALNEIPASVAFPVYSCGTIALAAVVSRMCFSEKITRRQWAALGLVLAALVLLNL